MSVFKDRERSMEAKFARDGELAFQARVQAFRFLAAWAAKLAGDTLEGEQALARELIREDMRSPGDEAALAVAGAFLGSMADEDLLRRKLEEFSRDAQAVVFFKKAS